MKSPKRDQSVRNFDLSHKSSLLLFFYFLFCNNFLSSSCQAQANDNDETNSSTNNILDELFLPSISNDSLAIASEPKPTFILPGGASSFKHDGGPPKLLQVDIKPTMTVTATPMGPTAYFIENLDDDDDKSGESDDGLSNEYYQPSTIEPSAPSNEDAGGGPDDGGEANLRKKSTEELFEDMLGAGDSFENNFLDLKPAGELFHLDSDVPVNMVEKAELREAKMKENGSSSEPLESLPNPIALVQSTSKTLHDPSGYQQQQMRQQDRLNFQRNGENDLENEFAEAFKNNPSNGRRRRLRPGVKHLRRRIRTRLRNDTLISPFGHQSSSANGNMEKHIRTFPGQGSSSGSTTRATRIRFRTTPLPSQQRETSGQTFIPLGNGNVNTELSRPKMPNKKAVFIKKSKILKQQDGNVQNNNDDQQSIDYTPTTETYRTEPTTTEEDFHKKLNNFLIPPLPTEDIDLFGTTESSPTTADSSTHSDRNQNQTTKSAEDLVSETTRHQDIHHDSGHYMDERDNWEKNYMNLQQNSFYGSSFEEPFMRGEGINNNGGDSESDSTEPQINSNDLIQQQQQQQEQDTPPRPRQSSRGNSNYITESPLGTFSPSMQQQFVENQRDRPPPQSSSNLHPNGHYSSLPPIDEITSAYTAPPAEFFSNGPLMPPEFDHAHLGRGERHGPGPESPPVRNRGRGSHYDGSKVVRGDPRKKPFPLYQPIPDHPVGGEIKHDPLRALFEGLDLPKGEVYPIPLGSAKSKQDVPSLPLPYGHPTNRRPPPELYNNNLVKNPTSQSIGNNHMNMNGGEAIVGSAFMLNDFNKQQNPNKFVYNYPPGNHGNNFKNFGKNPDIFRSPDHMKFSHISPQQTNGYPYDRPFLQPIDFPPPHFPKHNLHKSPQKNNDNFESNFLDDNKIQQQEQQPPPPTIRKEQSTESSIGEQLQELQLPQPRPAIQTFEENKSTSQIPPPVSGKNGGNRRGNSRNRDQQQQQQQQQQLDNNHRNHRLEPHPKPKQRVKQQPKDQNEKDFGSNSLNSLTLSVPEMPPIPESQDLKEILPSHIPYPSYTHSMSLRPDYEPANPPLQTAPDTLKNPFDTFLQDMGDINFQIGPESYTKNNNNNENNNRVPITLKKEPGTGDKLLHYHPIGPTTGFYNEQNKNEFRQDDPDPYGKPPRPNSIADSMKSLLQRYPSKKPQGKYPVYKKPIYQSQNSIEEETRDKFYKQHAHKTPLSLMANLMTSLEASSEDNSIHDSNEIRPGPSPSVPTHLLRGSKEQPSNEGSKEGSSTSSSGGNGDGQLKSDENKNQFSETPYVLMFHSMLPQDPITAALPKNAVSKDNPLASASTHQVSGGSGQGSGLQSFDLNSHLKSPGIKQVPVHPREQMIKALAITHLENLKESIREKSKKPNAIYTPYGVLVPMGLKASASEPSHSFFGSGPASSFAYPQTHPPPSHHGHNQHPLHSSQSFFPQPHYPPNNKLSAFNRGHNGHYGGGEGHSGEKQLLNLLLQANLSPIGHFGIHKTAKLKNGRVTKHLGLKANIEPALDLIAEKLSLKLAALEYLIKHPPKHLGFHIATGPSGGSAYGSSYHEGVSYSEHQPSISGKDSKKGDGKKSKSGSDKDQKDKKDKGKSNKEFKNFIKSLLKERLYEMVEETDVLGSSTSASINLEEISQKHKHDLMARRLQGFSPNSNLNAIGLTHHPLVNVNTINNNDLRLQQSSSMLSSAFQSPPPPLIVNKSSNPGGFFNTLKRMFSFGGPSSSSRSSSSYDQLTNPAIPHNFTVNWLKGIASLSSNQNNPNLKMSPNQNPFKHYRNKQPNMGKFSRKSETKMSKEGGKDDSKWMELVLKSIGEGQLSSDEKSLVLEKLFSPKVEDSEWIPKIPNNKKESSKSKPSKSKDKSSRSKSKSKKSKSKKIEEEETEEEVDQMVAMQSSTLPVSILPPPPNFRQNFNDEHLNANNNDDLIPRSRSSNWEPLFFNK